MSDSHPMNVRTHVKAYIIVFAALLGLTALTVSVAMLHLSTGEAVIIALFIASIKGSLVACFFMHLLSEKRLIPILLAFTVFFFFALLLLPTAEVFSRGG